MNVLLLISILRLPATEINMVAIEPMIFRAILGFSAVAYIPRRRLGVGFMSVNDKGRRAVPMYTLAGIK